MEWCVPEAFYCGNVGDVGAEESHGGRHGGDEHGEDGVLEGVGHQALQTLQLPAGLLALLLLPNPGQDEGVISPNSQGNDDCEDVHEGEEWKSEDKGIGEVGQAEGETNGGDGGDGDCQAGGEAPDWQEDKKDSKEQVRGVLH